jgi:hypothetical protein
MPSRLLLSISLSACLASAAMAGTPAGPPGRVGAAITTRKPTEIAALAKDPQKYVGRTVRIDGTVKKVCQGAGCWVEVASSQGQTFLAKSLDESVLLPKDCAGCSIRVQGVVTILPARDAAAHQHTEPVAEGHECPAPTYLISTQGAELVASRKR